MLIGDISRHNGRRYRNKTAVISEGRELSWGAVDERANRLGTYLQSTGLKKGDRVAVCARNTLEWPEITYGLAKAGLVHPDGLANVTASNPSRFQAGKVLIEGQGTGAWNAGDAQTGQAANKNYARMAFPVFSYDGGAPTIAMGAGSGWVSYLSKGLSPDRIKECLRIVDIFTRSDFIIML